MNILIVDDDRFVVAALTTGLNWKKLGFQNVYTAYNIEESKKILEKNQIHLLLSDIDMPNGSGLDLLAWIRERRNNMPAIFLTNYADFHYAQKALELKTFYYFLKPIEYDKLENIIMEATWEYNKHLKRNSENFWQLFLRKTTFIDSAEHQDFREYPHSPYRINDYFLPVIFEAHPYYLDSDHTLKNYFPNFEAQTAYLTTTFNAVFSDMKDSIAAFLMYNEEYSRYIAVFHSNPSVISPSLFMNCENFISLVQNQMHSNLNIFIGIPASLQDFQRNFSKLRSMVEKKVCISRQISSLENYKASISDFDLWDTKLPKLYLDTQEYESFLKNCSQYLNKLAKTNTLCLASINSFQIDALNILYSFLRNKGILPNKLFQDESFHILSRLACRSISNMELYLEYIIHTTKNYLETSSSEQSIAEQLKKYADEHFTEDIHASDIADIFFIDSDYGSKLFKMQFNISFKNYIIGKRIETAKSLLMNTNLSIHTISTSVGYENYSYFTRLFKKTEGITPVEYRAQNGNKSNQT